MDAYRDVFLAESGDYLMQITDGLLALERDSSTTEPVEVIFRGAHSLKGMAAAMGYERTADLTHKMEGLMDKVRKGELTPGKPIVDLMLAAVDLVRDLIDEEMNGRTDIDPTEMVAALLAAAEGTAVEPEPAAAVAEPGTGAPVPAADSAAGESGWRVVVSLDEGCVLKAVRAYMVIKRLSHMGTIVETRPEMRAIEDEEFEQSFEVIVATQANGDAIRDAVAKVSEVASASVEPWAKASLPAPIEVTGERPQLSVTARRRRDIPKLSETQTVRVAIGHLDTLVDLVGELVILRSRLEGISEHIKNPELTETVDELQRISTDLQYEVMQTRMVPVGNIFNRFPRMVRDLASDLGRQIDFSMSGLDIELDRTVLDEIGDPLVHLLRNSIDHGVETPEERLAAGKPAEGAITLSASRERDHVAIVVSDDGKGIDPERVWAKAVQRGLVQESERFAYDDHDILMITCIPGFSTAEKTTKVSGRGVGMDVVKGKIEHLGGTVHIKSCVGTGTDFILRLPLTLAIVHALLVESAGQVFALPLSSVDEVFLAEELTIDTIDGSPVVILRDGGVVPLHRLDALLFGAEPAQIPEPRSSVVLLDVGEEQRALHVDAMCGRTEIVVKPLSRLFRDTKGFSGATILGDGRVLLILDPRTIFQSADGVVR